MTDAESRARILFLTPQAPYPPEQGTAIRNYNLIRETSRRHAVGLLTFEDGDSDSVDLGQVEAESVICARAVAHPSRTMTGRLCTLGLTGRPDMADRLASDAFRTALWDVLDTHNFDIVQIEGIEMARYGLDIRRRFGSSGPAIVFDDHNAEYLLQRRAMETDKKSPHRWLVALYSWVQWRRLRRFEREVCRAADATLCVSEVDRIALQDLLPDREILVLANGVDVERYRPGRCDTVGLDHPAIVFTGKMDYRPNVDAVIWFYDAVWPLVRAQRPQAQLYIVGKNPHVRLGPLQSGDPSVIVTGYVDDPVPFFAGSDAYIVPMRIGGGTRLKVLEAMAAGCAMVTTSLGCEGIGLTDGVEAFIADDAADFAQAVLAAMEDTEQTQEMRHRARQFVLREYDWRNIVPRVDPVYAQLLRAVFGLR